MRIYSIFLLLFQHVGRNNILKQAMVYKKTRIWVAKPFLLEDYGRVRCSDVVVSVIVGGYILGSDVGRVLKVLMRHCWNCVTICLKYKN